MTVTRSLKYLLNYFRDAWIELYRFEAGSGQDTSQSYFVPDRFPGASLWYSVIKHVALFEVTDGTLEEHSFMMRGTKEEALLWALDIFNKNSATWFKTG